MYRPDGRQIKEQRLRQGLSQRALSRLAKVDKRTITAWEDNRFGPDFYFNKLARIASVLTLPYADLIEYFPDPEERPAQPQ